MIPRDRMQRYQLPNIGDATGVLTMLPIENITYRLHRVTFNVAIGTGPLQPWIRLTDGGGQVTFATAVTATNGVAGVTMHMTFSFGLERTVLIGTAPGGHGMCNAPLPPDLYVTPGDILAFGLNNATAPGSGGDDWFSTMVDIVIPA